jgi:DTW domain-containing protein YfiP
MAREVCYRCIKPRAMCLCERVPRVDNRTQVLVLQHPRERLHAIGTARFAQLGLGNARVEVAWRPGEREEQPPRWLPEGTALLYPSPGARELSGLSPDERPRNLIVLDGTWHTAKTLYREKRWLHRLPHVRLTPRAPSRYRLRREPAADYVSTIEAIVEALCALEPETAGLNALLAAFDSMIDDQLAFVRRGAGSRHARRRRPEAQRRLPEALVSGLSRLVVVYAESSRARCDAERELVQVTAQALGSQAAFQRHLRAAQGIPNPIVLGHMRLSPSDFEHADDLPRFRAAWREFLAAAGDPAIVAAWNQSTFDLLRAAGAELPAQLVLKSAYRARFGARHASLDDVIAAEALTPEPAALRGRAAWRVACAAAVARHLHGLQATPA